MVRSDTVSIVRAACPGVIFPRARSINAEPTARLKSSYLIPLGPATFEVIRYKEGMSDLQNMDDCLNEKTSEDDKYSLSGNLTLVIFNRSYEQEDDDADNDALKLHKGFIHRVVPVQKDREHPAFIKPDTGIIQDMFIQGKYTLLHGFGFVLHLFTKSFTMSLVSLKKHA